MIGSSAHRTTWSIRSAPTKNWGFRTLCCGSSISVSFWPAALFGARDARTAERSVSARPKVLVCCNSIVREEYITGEGLDRLGRLADWEWPPSEGTSSPVGVRGGPSVDPADAARLAAKLGEGFD